MLRNGHAELDLDYIEARLGFRVQSFRLGLEIWRCSSLLVRHCVPLGPSFAPENEAVGAGLHQIEYCRCACTTRLDPDLTNRTRVAILRNACR